MAPTTHSMKLPELSGLPNAGIGVPPGLSAPQTGGRRGRRRTGIRKSGRRRTGRRRTSRRMRYN